MDSCKYTYSNYIGAGKSDHEKLMLLLDKLEKEEETSNKEISESEKKRIREMNEIHNYFESLRPIKKRKTVKKLRWAPEETLKNIKEIENDETRGRSIEYARELERDNPGSSYKFFQRYVRDEAWKDSVLKYLNNKKQRAENPDPKKEEFWKTYKEHLDIEKERKNIKPERIGGGNLIGRMERLSKKKPKKKPKKKLRWADGAHDPSWLPSEEDRSNIENVQEIDARSEGFDETRGKSYEHSYALEKEKPGSSLGWKDYWFHVGLNEYKKNPYKNDGSKKFEEYERNLKESNEIIKELANKKYGGAVESPMHTPPRVRTSMSSIIVKSNEYGLDVMLGEDLETPDQDTSIDSYVESNCIKEINKVLSDKDMEKQQKIMAINRLDKDICPRQLKMNGLQAAHLGKLELPSNKDNLPKQSSEKKVFDFVNETLSEGQIPIIIKLLNEKTYFFTQENIFKQLNNGLVFPCYQANNLATTHEPPPDLPYGIKPGQQNWDDSEKLFSFQTLLNRRVLVSFDDFKELVLNPKTIPVTIVGRESERKIPAIMKYQWVVVKHPITGDIIRTGWEFVGGVGMLHCNKIRWANEKETFWNIENADISFTKEEEEKLKEYPNFRKVPPPLTPPPPLSPPPPSSNGSFYTQNTVYTMSTDYSPPPPSLHDDSDPSPLYSDDSVTRITNRDRPAPLRLSFSSAVDDDIDAAQYEENVDDILENAARLRREMYEQNVSDGDGDVLDDVPPPPSIPRMSPSNESDSELYATPARRPRPPDEPMRSSRPRVGYRLRRQNDENSIFENELRERDMRDGPHTPQRSSVRSDPNTQNSSGRSSYQSNISPELWENS